MYNIMEKFYFEDFLKKANEIHNNKYDYSKVEYVNNKTKICIICPVHGEFWQLPCNHLKGCGCQKCSNEKRHVRTTEEFIFDAKKVHGDKYDYSKTDLTNKDEEGKVIITCKKHGDFKQLPSNHLQGKGCYECSRPKRLTTEECVRRAKLVHGDKYDYSKLEYKGYNEPITVICPIHGEFKTTVDNHIRLGTECKYCSHRSFKYTTEEFIEEAKKIHGDKYDYSKVEYVDKNTPIIIICKKHGEFKQIPSDHIYNKSGCPFCKTSKLEEKIKNILTNNNIEFEYQKKFDWLGRQSLDFYLTKYNTAIECQGEQHYKLVDFGNKGIEWATSNLEKVKELDKRKLNLCYENNVKLIYFAKEKYDENIIIEENKLKEEILNT